MDVKNILRNSVLCQGLTDTDLEELEKISTMRNCYKNEIIFSEKQQGSNLFLLAEGRVVLERRSLNQRPVPPTQITVVRQGQLFGEMGFVENRPRSATARARSQVKLLEIDGEALRRLVESDDGFGRRFMTNLAVILSKRLRRMDEQWLSAIAHHFPLPEFEYM